MISNKLTRITKSEFGRNLLTVFTGNTIAQAIPIAVAPFLTRLYSPNEYALLGLFLSTSMLFGSISTLQYDRAIVLPKEEKVAQSIVVLSFIAVFFITTLVALVMLFFNHAIVKMLKNDGMELWLYLVPISVFLQGIFRILDSWSTRKKKFRRVAARKVIQTGTNSLTKLSLGVLGKTNGGLIIGSLMGQLISTLLLFLQVIKDKLALNEVSIKEIKQSAIRYKNFPLFTNWQGLSSTLNTTGIRYMISSYSGATLLGLYSFTYGFLNRPLQLIGQSISQVFYQRFAEKNNQGHNLWKELKTILSRLFVIGIVPFSIVLFFGPEIFEVVFGKEWREAGKIAQILTPWMFGRFLVSPVSSLSLILDKQKTFFVFGLIFNFVVLGLFFILYRLQFAFHLLLLMVSIIVFVYSMLLLIWFRKISK